MRTILGIILIVLVVLGLAFWLLQTSKVDPTTLPGEAIEIQGAEHIADGSTEHPPYNSNPPTSGWHWPKPAACLAYDTPQPDERIIHNLEHGSVWITYKPSIPEETKSQLKSFAQRYSNVVVSPREANDANIALAAWGRLLNLDNYDESKILEFIHAFMDKAPEKVPCGRF